MEAKRKMHWNLLTRKFGFTTNAANERKRIVLDVVFDGIFSVGRKIY